MTIAQPVRRILLVALDNLGDLVFASALTPPIHAAFPDAIIDVWAKAYTADVGRLIPHVRSVHAANPFWAASKAHARPRVGQFVRSVLGVRRGRYDVAILSEAPWRTAAAVAATRIPVRVGMARHRNAAFLTHVLPAEDAHKSVLREQARLLEVLNVESRDPRYRLEIGPIQAIRDKLSSVLPSKFVALHPFASDRNRCVPLNEWTQLAFALKGRGLAVLWIGTPYELDELRRGFTHPRGYYADQLLDRTLATSAAALSLASTFVGHDSGPLHIAGAFGVPVVGIFAPGQPDRTYPQGVGPSRLIARPTPAGITVATLLAEIDALSIPSLA